MLSYENDPAIYFAEDSVSHSFYRLKATVLSDTVFVRVNAMGEVSTQDRPISIAQTNVGEADAAIPGVHYVPFDNPDLKKLLRIEAGKAFTEVPIVVLRDASLGLGKVRLALRVESNEYFRPGIDKKRSFVITTSDLSVKPSIWDNEWSYFFGPSWGSVKMRFMIDATGYIDWEIFPDDYNFVIYLQDVVLQRFLEYNIEHPDDPLCEADGTPVVFE
jgi:hypothetical protein